MKFVVVIHCRMNTLLVIHELNYIVMKDKALIIKDLRKIFEHNSLYLSYIYLMTFRFKVLLLTVKNNKMEYLKTHGV
jgi:hypothetical protein